MYQQAEPQLQHQQQQHQKHYQQQQRNFILYIQCLSNNSTIIMLEYPIISCELENFLRTKFMGSQGKKYSVTP